MARDYKDLVVGLDIGTAKVMVVVAEVMPGGELKLAGLGVAPSNGLKRGVVVNIDATVQSIQQALKEAELMADCKITRVYTGITGSHIRGINSTGMVAVKDKEVTAADVARVEAAYGELARHPALIIKDYIHDMDKQYATADLVISRSGTGTLSELAASGTPAILIPLPTAADDHQNKNAQSFARKGAAVVLVQKEITADKLFATVEDLRQAPQRLSQMAQAMRDLHHPHAAETLVRQFLQRMETHAAR